MTSLHLISLPLSYFQILHSRFRILKVPTFCSTEAEVRAVDSRHKFQPTDVQHSALGYIMNATLDVQQPAVTRAT